MMKFRQKIKNFLTIHLFASDSVLQVFRHRIAIFKISWIQKNNLKLFEAFSLASNSVVYSHYSDLTQFT